MMYCNLRLIYVSRDMPLENLHPLALSAARAARCAGDQGKFWEMRNTILENNQTLTPASVGTFAKDLKLNLVAFNACTSRYEEISD